MCLWNRWIWFKKYIGSGGAAPRLNKLSGGDWKKTKARAKAAIENMAEELVKLTAERQIQQGHAFCPRYRVGSTNSKNVSLCGD